MTQHLRKSATVPDDSAVEREARRILRRLSEPAACLAVASEMEKAVVVREAEDGSTTRTAVVERSIAQAMALRDWITCAKPGRVSRYHITGKGRSALKQLLTDGDTIRSGFAEAPALFAGKSKGWGKSQSDEIAGRNRINVAESPVAAMARRKDKSGHPFLSLNLVNAAERLREDFEIAQMGPRDSLNWDRFLKGDYHEQKHECDKGLQGSNRARARVSNALRELGPGLGEVALRVCCYLEGLESAEKRMGWSARSGKVVLRIALQRLKRHYDSLSSSSMIG